MTARRQTGETAQAPTTLIEHVQKHERDWGNETYPDRPDLATILQSPVVAFWEKPPKDDKLNEREFITVHDSLAEIEQYITRLIFRMGVQQPERKLIRVFEKGARMKIKAVNIVFEKTDS